MSGSFTEREYFAAIQHVDESFRAYLECFCRMLAEPPAREELMSILGKLSTALHQHFELEERDGYLGEAVAFAPRFSEEANRLLAQHPILSEELSALLERLRENDFSEAGWPRFIERANRFVKMLVEHERAENDLVQSAYEHDIGDKD